jgi:L-fucose isomerase-like protein
MDKLKVALVGTIRPIFKGNMRGVLAHSIEVMKKKSEEMDFDFVSIEKGMETLEDAKTASEVLEKQGVDFIIIQNSSFADGDMILPFFSNTARLGIWAVEETTQAGPLPLNSFCATNLYMSIAGRFNRGYDKPVKWFYGNIESDLFEKRFKTTVRALTAVKKLKSSKILMIGDIVPGYHDENFDSDKLKQIFGVCVEKIDLNTFYGEYETTLNNKTLTELAENIKNESNSIQVNEDYILKAARAEVTFKEIISKYQASAITFRCWPEVPSKIGLMVCSTIGRLNQNHSVAATESDVLGALSMLTLKYLNNRATVLMDLSGWDRSKDSIYIWHCGNIPKEWFDGSGFHLANHFNRDTVGVVREGKMKSGLVTGLRFLEDDSSAFLVSGNFSDQKTPLYKGCSTWMKDLRINGHPVSSEDFMNTLLVNAIPHHLAYVDNDSTDSINELCAWLNINILNPLKYQNYLQKPMASNKGKL